MPASSTFLRFIHWIAFAAGSLLLTAVLSIWLSITAALIAPMVVGALLALRGTRIGIPRPWQSAAQAMTGCAISSHIDAAGLNAAAGHVWQILAVVLFTLMSAAAVAAWMLRTSSLPGSSSAWGCMPGAAPAMAILAEHHGDSGVIVSAMQYARVIIVVVSTSLVIRTMSGLQEPSTAAGPAPLVVLASASFTPMPWGSMASAILVAALGAWLAGVFRLTGGALLLPIVLGSALNLAWPGALHVPQLLLLLSFVPIGGAIGLQFRPELGRALLRNSPHVLLAILVLQGLCILAAWAFTRFGNVSAITAFLATSPGGLDSIAAVAIGSTADMAVVTATQSLRLFAVVLSGPLLVRQLMRFKRPAH